MCVPTKIQAVASNSWFFLSHMRWPMYRSIVDRWAKMSMCMICVQHNSVSSGEDVTPLASLASLTRDTRGKSSHFTAAMKSLERNPVQDLCSPWDLPRDMVLLCERDRASHRMSAHSSHETSELTR